MLVRTDIPKLLTAGLRKEFMKGWEEVTTDWERITTVIPSTKDKETYAWLGAVPKVRIWKDERQPRGLLEHSFTITNEDFEASIAVDRNALEDEQYGQIKIRVRELAAEARRFFDELMFTLLAQADQTTGKSGTILEGKDIKCYDGKACVATNHSEGLSGTQSNKGTSALSASSLQAAITAMKKFKDDQGKPRHVVPDLLVVPPDLEFKARELLHSAYFPEEGSTTAKLATNVLRGVVDLLVTPYLTDTNNWFLLCTKRVIKPIIYQERKAPEFVALDTGTESLFMRKTLYYGVDFRGMCGWGDWRNVYGSIVS